MVSVEVGGFAFEVDPVLVAIALALLGFSLYVYLWVRRTFTAFGQGYKRGKD